LIDPCIEFKPVECNANHTDADLGERAAHLGVEAVAIHAEKRGASRKRIRRGKSAAR
jgi:hypothetical protein